MNDKPNYYAVIPAFIRYHKWLTDFQKLLYWELVALSNKEWYCRATNQYLGELFGKSETRISKSIAVLESIKVIEIERQKAIWENRKIYISELPSLEVQFKGGWSTVQAYAWSTVQANNTRWIIKYNNISESEFREKIEPVINIKKEEWYEVSDLTEQATLCRLHHKEKKWIKIAVTAYNNWLSNAIKYGKITKKKKRMAYATLDDD